MAKELTKQDAINFPANFMYLWATESFLGKIDQKHATIIRAKKKNQYQLVNSLGSDGKSIVETAGSQILMANILASFKAQYGVTPAKALEILAAGGQIAGKDWKNGVYGIGATPRSNFSQNTYITVDPTTGMLSYKGSAVECTPVYGDGGKVTNYNAIIEGGTYSSIYDAASGQYYAYTYTPGDGSGKQYTAGGSVFNASSSNSVWQNVLSIAQTFGDWVLNILRVLSQLFGWNIQTTQVPPITAANTLPSQTADGFVYKDKAGTSIGMIAIIAGAAALIFSRRRKRD